MNSDDFSLSALLSKVLVGFTIEFDNEFEAQMPHRMTISHSLSLPKRGPWLASQAMWANFMRYVSEEGQTVTEIEQRARTVRLPLAGMQRWGYVTVAPDPADHRPKPPAADWIIRPTPAGRIAQDVWQPLAEIIETRWQERFGSEPIARLRTALADILDRVDAVLPDYLPIVGYGLWTKDLVTKESSSSAAARNNESRLELSTLLSRALLVFATEFEKESRLSLAICANCLRVVDWSGARVRDLPILTGVSREAIAISTGYLEREGYLTIETDPADARTKLAMLTTEGTDVRKRALKRIQTVERDWSERFGEETIRRLRQALLHFFDDPQGQKPLLATAFDAYPRGWRLSKPYAARTAAIIRAPAAALPQFPIVTHRGGYPDGS